MPPLLRIAMALLFLFVMSAAHAADRRKVVVLRTGSEPACFSREELTAALQRDGRIDVRAEAGDAGGDPAAIVRVRVYGHGNEVEVTLVGDGALARRVLTPTSCDTT